MCFSISQQPTTLYGITWHHGLTCNLLQLLPDRHAVHMIMEMIGSRSFTLTTGQHKRSGYDGLEWRHTVIRLGIPSLQHLHP